MIYYLGATFSSESEKKLWDWRLHHGLTGAPGPKLGFHATIAYSRTKFVYLIHGTTVNVTATTLNPTLLGSSLVLPLSSEWLETEHHVTRIYGASWDYATYQPHVTVAEAQSSIPSGLFEPLYLVINGLIYREYER